MKFNRIKNSAYKSFINLAIVFWVAAAALPGISRAGESQSQFAIDLINWIRLDPLAYAEALGYDRQALLPELPWLSGMLDQGLPPLTPTDFLTAKAAAKNNLTGNTVPPVSGFSEDYAQTGQISGVVSFQNFITSRKAISIIIDNQFRNELKRDYSGQRCILNPDLGLGGVSLKNGTDLFGHGNAYYLTVSMGSSLGRLQRQVLNQINQLRNDPRAGSKYVNAGLSAWSGSNSPLFVHRVLQVFAGTGFIDTPDYAEHAKNYGYSGMGTRKSGVLEIFPAKEPDNAAFRVFSSLVTAELAGNPDGPVILEPGFNDTGLNIDYVSGETAAHASADIIGGLSARPTRDNIRIYGLVYADTSGNEVYTPGEGRSGRVVRIYDRATFEQAAIVVTDHTGHFSVSLPGHREYTLQTGSNDAVFGGDGYFDRDRFYAIKVAEK